MDTSTQPVATKRQYRSLEEKRRIVEEALAEGASVARVARVYGVNANLVFNWRKQYKAGELGKSASAKLLPVKIGAESSPPLLPSLLPACDSRSSSGTIHIQLGHAQVRVEGNADPELLRVLLKCLRR